MRVDDRAATNNGPKGPLSFVALFNARIERFFRRDRVSVVAATPGFSALHLDVATSTVVAIPVVAWAIDADGNATPVVAQTSNGDAVIEFPNGLIDTATRTVESRSVWAATVLAERAKATP
jgi:hypothetical protein